MKRCTVDVCETIISESQEFCARCWNEVPKREQYILGAARESLNDAKSRYAQALTMCRTRAGQRIKT